MTALNASDPSKVQLSNQAADGAAAPAADDSDSDSDDGEKQKQKQNTAKPTPTPTPAPVGASVSGAAASAGGGQKVAVAPEGWVAAPAAGDAGTNAAKPADVVEAFYGDESSVRTGESKIDGTAAV
jgi:hypothetical protein